MKTCLYAFTPPPSDGNAVPYVNVSAEDGKITLSVRSAGPAGYCRECGSQEPHSASIELPDNEIDSLIVALLNRRLLQRTWQDNQAILDRLAELERRTLPLVTFGGPERAVAWPVFIG